MGGSAAGARGGGVRLDSRLPDFEHDDSLGKWTTDRELLCISNVAFLCRFHFCAQLIYLLLSLIFWLPEGTPYMPSRSTIVTHSLSTASNRDYQHHHHHHQQQFCLMFRAGFSDGIPVSNQHAARTRLLLTTLVAYVHLFSQGRDRAALGEVYKVFRPLLCREGLQIGRALVVCTNQNPVFFFCF